MSLSCVVVHHDESLPLAEVQVASSSSSNDTNTTSNNNSNNTINTNKVSNNNEVDEFAKIITTKLGQNVKETLLLRSHHDKSNGGAAEAGLFAYSVVPILSPNESGTIELDTTTHPPNIRATRLAMACGQLSLRFWGTVILIRSHGCVLANEGKATKGGFCVSLTLQQVQGACCISPDLRSFLRPYSEDLPENAVPTWLANAAQNNYHDAASLARLAAVMTSTGFVDNDDEDVDDEDEVEDDEHESKASPQSHQESSESEDDDSSRESAQGNTTSTLLVQKEKYFVARSSLCLHCRGPTNSLCPECEGVYYCEEPRRCRISGWSHACLCQTWRRYTERRDELSTFPFEKWHHQLMTRQCQISEEPYQQYLTETLGVSLRQRKGTTTTTTWWSTEVGGWSGGDSNTAQTVDPFLRRSFAQGFAPVRDCNGNIPPEYQVTLTDIERCEELWGHPVTRNACNLILLSSWEQYYELRDIPRSSPVALLLTFPLTIYYAIAKHGEVPVTVARMLKRPLRIHVVGVEKEMNFLDLFKELSFLLPEDLQVELIFVVREDMLPPKCRRHQSAEGYSMNISLTPNLVLLIASGTYGDSLDPNFDCGSGLPDMVVGLNAGLFAYESWRSVIAFLDHHEGVVGVFTDYNEHSGVNCASLGGGKARESLTVNPFRQPLSLPVYCMNLPQFSNGFMYVFNEQKLDM